MKGIHRIAGPLLLLLCAGLLIAEVLVRPAVGIANNGDFPKMAGPLALGPETGTWESHQFNDFVYTYVRADRYRYYGGFWSSEYLLLKVARGLQRILHAGPRFDIRWLGSVHGAILLLGIGLWIYALDSRWRLWGGLWTVAVWTDVAYVQYLNSMYTDAVALVSLVLCAGAGLQVVRRRNSRTMALLLAGAAVLFAASKSQHALPALLFIPLFLCFAFWSQDRAVRTAWVAGSALLVLVAAVLVNRTTDDYKNEGVFNLVFLRLAPEAPNRLAALRELGLGKEELAYLGMWAFVPNVPLNNPEWARQFHVRCNYATVLRYYLRHPSVPSRALYVNLSGQAPLMRPFANQSVEDGFKPDARASGFGSWSDLRAWLLERAPWHLILVVLAVLGSSVWLLLRSPEDRPFAGLALTMQMLAVLEYGIAVLADAAETFRHLVLFNVATDISILMLALLIGKVVARRRAGAPAGGVVRSMPGTGANPT
ncbi:MAG: hypothetical protein LAP40_06180 [Acidobacteriia bacterium]|nr:hypothetical protein [Terriglobia bacterium]